MKKVVLTGRFINLGPNKFPLKMKLRSEVLVLVLALLVAGSLGAGYLVGAGNGHAITTTTTTTTTTTSSSTQTLTEAKSGACLRATSLQGLPVGDKWFTSVVYYSGEWVAILQGYSGLNKVYSGCFQGNGTEYFEVFFSNSTSPALLNATAYKLDSSTVTLQMYVNGKGSSTALPWGSASVLVAPNHRFVAGIAANLVIGQRDFISRSFFDAQCACQCFSNQTNQTSLCSPFGLAFDPSGDIWVADTWNARVLEYVPPFYDGMPAALVIGQPNFSSQNSSGCAVHPTRNLLCGPSSITFDLEGSMWVSDESNNRILRYDPPFSMDESPSMVIGQPNFTSTTCSRNPPSASGLCYPSGIAFDKSGNMWVADWGNGRVLEYAPPFSTGIAAKFVIGQENLSSDVSVYSPVANILHQPTGIAFDSNGSLWVSDAGNRRVLQYKAPFVVNESASLVLGEPDFHSSNPTCNVTQKTLCEAGAIAFDSSGSLWVADSNARVLEFIPPFLVGMAASLVIGQPNFTSASCNTSAISLCGPRGLGIDRSGNVWVADTTNSRVLRFGEASLLSATNMFGTGTTSIMMPTKFPIKLEVKSDGYKSWKL